MRIIGNNPAADNAEITAIASGTLPSGQPVIVNADGTVSVVAPVSQALGSAVVFESATVGGNVASTFDSNLNKVVIVYQDTGNSFYGTAIVGTLSGTSISFGTPVVFSSANRTQEIQITFDSNSNKVVIAYDDKADGQKGKAVVGTVSGTGISFGSIVTFNNGSTDMGTPNAITFDSNSNKVVIAFQDKADSNKGKAIVGTVSGTNISFGSEATFLNADYATYVSATFDSNSNKVVIVYKDGSNSTHGYAVVGTVSSTSISFGTPVVFESAATNNPNVAFDTVNNKIVIAYADGTVGTAIVGTVSGTAISFGSPVIFNSTETTGPRVRFDATASKIVIAYGEGSGNAGTFKTGTVSGTSISFGSATVFESGATNAQNGLVYDSNAGKMVLSYYSGSNSGYGTSKVLQNSSTNLTTENFIGMSSGAVTTGTSSQALGSAVVFESAQSTQIGSAYDSTNNKVVVAYSDDADSYKGKAVVGTVDTSDNSISFGTPVQFEAGNTEDISAAFDANSGKIVIAFKDSSNSGYGTAIVGTVSGTGISFGSAATFESAASNDINVVYDSTNNKVVIVYSDGGNSSYGTAIVGTVSGTSISFGSAVVFSGSNQGELTFSSFDSTLGKVVVAYQQSENSGYAAVGTVSGTNISFGSPVNFNGGTNKATRISCAYDSTANRTVIFYRDQGNSSYDTAIVGTVSGTTISFGTKTVVTSQVNNYRAIAHDANAGTNVLAVSGNYNFKVGTVDASDNSMTFSGATTFEGASANFVSALFDSTGKKVVLSYQDSGNSNYGTSTVVSLAAPIIIRAEVASGSNAVIDIGCAISTNQLSLTAGQQYFVQTDGTLGLTAASPSVIAGTAVSATEIIVKG